MTPDGQFVQPPHPSGGSRFRYGSFQFNGSPMSGLPLGARVFGVAVLVAVLAGALVVAALALWFALALIPVAVGAALVALAVFRFRLWRAGVSGGRAPTGAFRRP